MVSGKRLFEVQWTKLLGILLVALALRLALDPDYPIPREKMREMERKAALESPMSRPSLLAPEPLSPQGDVRRLDLRFHWQWAGPSVDWTIVVFDDNLERIVEMYVGPLLEASLDEHSAEKVPVGTALHWQVEGLWKGHLLRSMPTPFRVLPSER